MTSIPNTITSAEQMIDIPAGQWALTDDGKALCLFDTHMGFPQRMWGSKQDGGTRGPVVSFTSLETAPMPLHLADIDANTCLHRRTNECGQCLFCGTPGIVASTPLFFSGEGELLRSVAEHNSRVSSAGAGEPAPNKSGEGPIVLWAPGQENLNRSAGDGE